MSHDTRKPKNPGWAGETGDHAQLSEADVRGTDYVGTRPNEGGHPGSAGTHPYYRFEKNPEAPLFEGPYRERLDKILSRYPTKQAALLPALNLVHELRGHLSPEAMEVVAHELELSPAYVRGVATFYTMYKLRPVGSYMIQVCTNVGCNLCGADDVMEAFLEHTDTVPGEISEDGLFSVIESECLGACGFPTVVQVNERYFENVTPEEVPAILASLGAEASKAAEADEAAKMPAGAASETGGEEE